MKRVLAVDLGASSGRVMLGSFDGEVIRLEEIHRFENNPVEIKNTLQWNLEHLLHEIKTGIAKAGEFDSVGIDTWGVDFGLIGKDGNLLEPPVHYRDKRTEGISKEVFELISKERLFEITGIGFMEINTVFQLCALKKHRAATLEKAEKLLLMPDLFNYLLTGNMLTESSIASTAQMMDLKRRTWSGEVLNSLDLPKNLLTKIIPSGTVIGKLENTDADVIAVCGHDTQCAIAAIPVESQAAIPVESRVSEAADDIIYISCGTWSLFGTELSEPIISKKTIEFGLSNELGFGGKTTLLKNITGLYPVQQLRKKYNLSYAELEKLDEVRKIYENLAAEHAQALREIKACTGKDYNTIHIVGGGSQSALLCQLTANACNCKVKAGPVEATAFGNVAIQLITSGIIPDLETARKIISKSCEVKTYLPEG
ncbi:MAG: rhamnulokinase [Oscillospiraceae bacterium]|jgi:rhamnulokinase/L-fuculokinase|nr:rhamnulokinase [Oscillospiraceae bacterium]